MAGINSTSPCKKEITCSAKGFTLVELLIGMVVSAIVVWAMYQFFISQQRNYNIQEQVAEMQQNIRGAMYLMVKDIREAGYKLPDGSTTVGITSAQANTLTLTKDLDGDGVVSAAETFTFDLLNSDIRLDGQPIAEDIVGLGFAYAFDVDDDDILDQTAGNTIWAYDSDNNGDLDLQTSGAVIPGGNVQFSAIRAVQIWVLARPSNPDLAFFDNRTYNMGSQAITPNDNFRHRLLSTTVKLRNMGLL